MFVDFGGENRAWMKTKKNRTTFSGHFLGFSSLEREREWNGKKSLKVENGERDRKQGKRREIGFGVTLGEPPSSLLAVYPFLSLPHVMRSLTHSLSSS
ncbi:hypothetical protein LOK49_LG03G01497 [Camellia lanceoleosa]|uniref:Uncharacterized protein n=1 Tax=Camellia lanceoleosa TaxID=1840588 RepID=A0ACC0IAE7_9ERIC|nr:hypothetical protein LOK49_LG03G01497 [Camellia lanceoleosa]